MSSHPMESSSGQGPRDGGAALAADGKELALDGMAGLAKGLRIIEVFADNHGSLTIAQAARMTGISRASARRCLLTLVNLGYLFKRDSAFQPTPRILRLSRAYFENATLPQLAQSYLEAARDELNESISLAVLEGGGALFIARAESERIVSTLASIGRRLPAYVSAAGRVMLADYSDADLDAYLAGIQPEAFTRHTITDKDMIRQRILDARRDRVEVVCEELEEGMVSMAVPVADASGRTVAAISMSASTARIPADRMRSEFQSKLAVYAAAVMRTL